MFHLRHLKSFVVGLMFLSIAAKLIAMDAEKEKGRPVIMDYDLDIRPILRSRCFKCHGPDSDHRKADLRLDRAKNAYAARSKSKYRPIVPGKPEASSAYLMIISIDPDVIMPPPDSNLDMNAAEKEKIRLWIAQGAKYPSQ